MAEALGVPDATLHRHFGALRAAAAAAARATADAQGLDAASAERYVAARVAAAEASERARLAGAMSPEVRGALGVRPDEMSTSASAGLLVVAGALTVVAGAVRRLRREIA